MGSRPSPGLTELAIQSTQATPHTVIASASEAIQTHGEYSKRRVDCFVAPAFALEGGLRRTRVLLAMTLRHNFAISRRPHYAPSFASISRPLRIEGRGEYRAPDAPAVSCAMVVVERTRAYGSHQDHPAFPRNGFNGYSVLSPVLRLFGHRRPREAFASQELDTSVGVSGPHDFARPHQHRSLSAHPRPPHPAPRP